jgi:hypothetical protein
MSDTVAASVIVAWLGDSGPSFIPDHGADLTTFGAGTSTVSGALHVAGGSSAPAPVSGFGSPLLVDFVSIAPGAGASASPGGNELPPTVSGYSGGLYLDGGAAAVPGAVHSSS